MTTNQPQERSLFERAVAHWIVKNHYPNFDPEIIYNIEFDMASEGYCETCHYDFPAITFNYKYGNKNFTNFDIPARYMDVGKFVEEVAEIAKELEKSA